MRQFNPEKDVLIVRTIDRIDDYRKLYECDIRKYASYNVAFFSIVNRFSIIKYVKATTYTPQIGKFLKMIKERKTFTDAIRYLVYKRKKKDGLFFICALFLFLPVKLSYNLMRIGIGLKSLNHAQ